MMRTRLTETDVIAANEQFILNMAYKHGRGLEPNDCKMIVTQSFLKAVRTHRKGIDYFHNYAERVIGNELAEERKYNGRIRSIESPFSLNMTFGNDKSEEFVHNFIYRTLSGDFVNMVIFRDFLNNLDLEEKAVAKLFIERYTQDEICSLVHIDKWQLKRVIDSIRIAWFRYNL